MVAMRDKCRKIKEETEHENMKHKKWRKNRPKWWKFDRNDNKKTPSGSAEESF